MLPLDYIQRQVYSLKAINTRLGKIVSPTAIQFISCLRFHDAGYLICSDELS